MGNTTSSDAESDNTPDAITGKNNRSDRIMRIKFKSLKPNGIRYRKIAINPFL
jgi:hypothetical protein